MGGLFSAQCCSSARLDGKTVVITGANSGIGKETARDLARRGAFVVMACRDMEKAEAAAAEIRADLSGREDAGQLQIVKLDLASLASVRACAQLILEQHPRIHLLINNAGLAFSPYLLTEDGFEMHLGVNHMGHFLFTCLLLPRLRISAPARIVIITSICYKIASIDFEDLKWEKTYSSLRAYARSKLANILFAHQLAQNLKDRGVTVYSVHPGVVYTDAGRSLDVAYFRGLNWLYKNVVKHFSMTAKQGAQTSIYCAVDESLAKETGQYYSDCQRTGLQMKARDPVVARRLWEESLRLTGLGDWDPCRAIDGSQPLSPAQT